MIPYAHMRERLLLTLAILLLTGCGSIGYYSQAVKGHLDLMAGREPLLELLEDPDTEPELKQRLRRVVAIREFASTQLLLPDNGSYRSLSRVEGRAVVWSLVATEEFSVEPVEWCYPVIGCASYRGFFSRQAGERQARELETEGLDVTLEPVPAYSTLGWFDDPLPSTVIHWPEARLAGLVFHELAHQRLYLPGDSAFNEAFANTLSWWGVQRWLETEGDEAALRSWRREQQRKQSFVALLQATRQRLSEIYRKAAGDAWKRQRKYETFQQLRSDYENLKRQWQGYGGYDAWFSRGMNNARLASLATYEHWTPAFRALLHSSRGDMAEFYRACELLAGEPLDERRRIMRKLLASESGRDTRSAGEGLNSGF